MVGDETCTEEAAMMIDCTSCRMRATSACDDCVVTFLVENVSATVELDAEEMDAVSILSAAGLLAPLRLRAAGRGRGAAAG